MPIPHHRLIKEIWSRSEGHFGFIATMRRPRPFERGAWHDEPVHRHDEIRLEELDQPHQTDLYFSPLLFNKAARYNATVGSPGVLFADLDEAPEPPLPPSVLWETSPGNLQAIWYLDEPVEDYDRWAKVNQQLTIFTGADRGGWMGSKVLRVPESVNWKRQEFGRLLYARNTSHSFDWFEDKLGQIVVPGKVDTTEIPRPDIPIHERGWLLRLYWQRMSLRARAMMVQERVPDRSLHIVRTAHELIACGFSRNEVWALLWTAPWNKWRDRPEQLWTEIVRADEAQ